MSEHSLEVARSGGYYSDVHLVDLNQPPFPFDEHQFSAAVCIGVLSYVADVEDVSREFIRLVNPGGIVVLTQRSDLFQNRRTKEVWQGLAGVGWRRLSWTRAWKVDKLKEHDRRGGLRHG